MTRRRIPLRPSEFAILVALGVVGLVTLYPFWNVVVLALNDATDSLRGGVYLWPRRPTLRNFRTVLAIGQLGRAALNTVLRTVCGVGLSVIATTMLGYVLTHREYVLRKVIQRLFVVTMYVSGGLIPTYFVIRGLGLRNSFLVYLLPTLVNAYYLLIVKSYMDTLPRSLLESARMDGAGEFRVYRTVAFPLALPAVATLALFVAVDQWNSWFDTFIYVSRPALTTLQFELMKVVSRSTVQVQNINEIRDRLSSPASWRAPRSGASLTSAPMTSRWRAARVAGVCATSSSTTEPSAVPCGFRAVTGTS